MPTIEQARAWYQGADAVHDFEHVLRVYRTAEKLAQTEGGDLEILRAAALLHDAEGTAPGGAARGSHHEQSAAFAEAILKEESWSADRIAAVQHCIRAHRFRSTGEAPTTIEAKILFDADKLDVIGAIGVARAIAYATLARTPVYAPPSKSFLERGEREAGEPHSAFHEYVFKLSKIKDRLFTPSARALAQERHQFLAAYFERLQEEYQNLR